MIDVGVPVDTFSYWLFQLALPAVQLSPFLKALSIVVLDDLFNNYLDLALGGKNMQKTAAWVNIKQQYWNFKRYTLWP